MLAVADVVVAAGRRLGYDGAAVRRGKVRPLDLQVPAALGAWMRFLDLIGARRILIDHPADVVDERPR